MFSIQQLTAKMFQWSNKNKYKARKQQKSYPKNSYNKINNELLVELESEIQPDLLETKLQTSSQPSSENITFSNGEDTLGTQLKILPQPLKEVSASLDENISITNGEDLLETQLKISPQLSKDLSTSFVENVTITNVHSKVAGISLEVIEFVKTALEVFFSHCYISCDLMEMCYHPNLMITPSENRDHLIVHNTQQNNCKMYQCSSKNDKEIIFIFLTFEEITSERKYYITSPSHIVSNHYLDTTIPCASVEITDALNETPIAVAKLLRNIETTPLLVGLYGGSFTWIMTGPEEYFNVKQGAAVYWNTRLDTQYPYVLNVNIHSKHRIFGFRLVRELTPKYFKTISVALDRILTDFRVYLYNSSVQTGILRTENTILKTAVLELEKNPNLKLAPSSTGMDYGVFPTNYNTFICINEEDTSLVKFLFQWYTSGRYYVTSTFHPKTMTVNSRIPCAPPVDITDALKCGHISNPLFFNTRGDGHVFTSNIFNWYMDESEGSFVVSSHKKGTDDNLYWTVCEGEGNIQLRDKDPSKLLIKLIDIS